MMSRKILKISEKVIDSFYMGVGENFKKSMLGLDVPLSF